LNLKEYRREKSGHVDILKKKELEKLTRKIFHDLHTDQAKHPHIVKRLRDLLSPEYLKLNKDGLHIKIF